MNRVYLCSPYTHPSAEVMCERFEQVCRTAGILMTQGDIVFSPVAHSHVIAELGKLRTDWDFWEVQDMSYLAEWATRLYVLALDGWEESVGVTAEIEMALSKNVDIPVRVVDIMGNPMRWIEREA